jgi:hypothetical protein
MVKKYKTVKKRQEQKLVEPKNKKTTVDVKQYLPFSVYKGSLTTRAKFIHHVFISYHKISICFAFCAAPNFT